MSGPRVAIHVDGGKFSAYWTARCEARGIDWVPVDCRANDIVARLADCDALMWHFRNDHPQELLYARQLMTAVAHAGKAIFPDVPTMWHFDDKVAQKYLLEAIGAPLAPAWVFYDRATALGWAASASFPKVHKLRCGAGSTGVRLVRSRREAARLIRRAFGKGFGRYDPVGSLRERTRKWRAGLAGPWEVVKGIARFARHPPDAIVAGPERGYVYFQEFVPDNDHDIRTVVIGDRCFAIKRHVREGDFRASGGGAIDHARELIDERTVELSFRLTRALRSQCAAYDFVFADGEPLVLEVSYGFAPFGYVDCPWYWDAEMTWHEGPFDYFDWMIDAVLAQVAERGK